MQVAGVSIERDDINHLLRANSIQETGIRVTYEFYGSDDEKDYRLLKHSEDNTIALEETDCRYIKVAAYNPDLDQQRTVYWEIELSAAGKGKEQYVVSLH